LPWTQWSLTFPPAQNRLWNLSHAPTNLTHSFFTLDSGTKLHYVHAGLTADQSTSTSGLIIFLHGFPDSWALWQWHLSSEKLVQNNTLIALDLPGYGGSDSLQEYGATSMLEAVGQFALEMRWMYLKPDEETDGHHNGGPVGGSKEKGRCVVVSHDWGAAIAIRLASEAGQLADRWIISNTIHVSISMKTSIRYMTQTIWAT